MEGRCLCNVTRDGSCRTAITPASSCGACTSTRAWMTMLSITAPTRSPTSWTPAVPPPACDTIGELLETQEHFSSTPTPWNSKQARPAGLACLQYQNKCFRLLCDHCRGVHPVFVASFWIRMSLSPELHGFEIFSKKRKKPVCTVLHGRLCIPPEHPSNFHLGDPNRKNRAEGKRIEKSWIFQIIVH